MSTISKHRVKRRQVFYIPGYDPHPPRRYRELYRKEAAEQASISGYEIGIVATSGGAGYGWQVQAVFAGEQVLSDVEVLVWSDLVRASMDGGVWASYAGLGRTASIYLRSGALRRLMRLRKGPVIAALYPVAFLLLQALIAGFLGLGAGWACVAALLAVWPGAGAVLAGLVALVVATGVAIAILRWFKRRDARLYAHYLMRDYTYGARLEGANPPELNARIAAFAERIAGALESDVDEVLVVGHSSGVQIGVQALAALEQARTIPADGPALGFLSLGQVVPMLSFLPQAHQLRADLRRLSVCEHITWVDVSAPGDGCSFALCDPVAVSGVQSAAKRWPLVISAAFSQTLGTEKWQALKRRYFRLHFQYLCAFDQPGDYDYFAITAGPMTLAERFANRAPSQSRIETPTSAHVSVTP